MSNFWVWSKSLALAVSGVMAVSTQSVIAQITQDSTLPNNSQVTLQDKVIIIEGGTRVGNNLFHSFKDFSVPSLTTAEFKNTDNVINIISRVTGNSISHIDGILKTQGTANLFLINPNGIIFGSQGTLNIRGSFVASTASSINFADGFKFSATNPQIPALLKVSVPIGLEFAQTANPIHNKSQANPNGLRNVGLQVQPNKTLALVGGDIWLEGGNLTATSGRIELGSVAPNSLVSINPTFQGWTLGYQDVQNFQNIRLTPINVNNVHVPSQVDASNREDNGGNIQVQGNNVELAGYLVRLRTQATGTKDGGDLTVNAKKLIVRDGAVLSTVTRGEGHGGKLTVNASESVEVIGSFRDPITRVVNRSGLFSSTGLAGKAGEININTKNLLIQNGGQIATDSIALFRNSRLIPGTGAGGDLTINASESVELKGTSSGLVALTNTSGDAGKVTITTKKLIVQDEAKINVSSLFDPNYTYPLNGRTLGKAGELVVTANSIVLDNRGQLTSNSDLGRGGNITLNIKNFFLMGGESQISTNAGKISGGGEGGNITINAANGFVIARSRENSDITANAFSGNGGKININASSILGFVPRTRDDLVSLLGTENPESLNPSQLPTNDITAFSQANASLNGTVQINTPDVDPSKGLVELSTNTVDGSRQITSSCNPRRNQDKSSFIATGRGGIAPSPTDKLISDAVLTEWISLPIATGNRHDSMQKQHTQQIQESDRYSPIIEAQGWIVDQNGKVVLVAHSPTITPHSPVFAASVACSLPGNSSVTPPHSPFPLVF
ncbi:S-layer family protein [Nostoc sp. TCL26-01]|nr:S-layer family protein [Nostoc sp. TCL26-01]